MMLTIGHVHLDSSVRAWLHRLLVAATLVGWLLLAGLIASLYVGHSSSPYGTCTAATGRTVSCDMLKRHKP
jgi:hypothetical protein